MKKLYNSLKYLSVIQSLESSKNHIFHEIINLQIMDKFGKLSNNIKFFHNSHKLEG